MKMDGNGHGVGNGAQFVKRLLWIGLDLGKVINLISTCTRSSASCTSCASRTLLHVTWFAPMELHDMAALSRSSVSVEAMPNLAWNLMFVFCSTLIVVDWQ